MRDLIDTHGLPLTKDYWFYVGGQRFRLGPSGLRTLRLFIEIGEKSRAATDRFWLLSLRPQIREMEQGNARAALCLAVSRARDERLRVLAIWLRGRCGGTLGTSIVATHAKSPQRLMRKEVARCLCRMSGWADLRQIEACEADPRIRRLASQSGPVTHVSRLKRFCQNVSQFAAPPGEPQLFLAPGIESRQGRPPRPPWLIRLFLERIHRLVNLEAVKSSSDRRITRSSH
jgi:hypothetical protein